MEKVFITGATGFLGIHLVKELLENHVQVYVLCRKDSPNLERLSEFKDIHLVYGTLEDMDRITDLCQEREFDVFYHLAWEGASGELRQDGEIQIKNILWTYKAAKAASDLKCKKIVVSGTVCENQCDSIKNQENFYTSSYYLHAKASSYSMVSSFCKRLGMPLVWCAFYHPVGRYNKMEQLITNTVYRMLHGEPLRFGTGQSLFDVVAAEDLCHGFYLAGKYGLKKDRYFIGGDSPRKLQEYLEEIKKLIQPDAVMQYGFYKTEELPMEPSWLDMTEFQQETGYQPQKSFADIILSLKEWLLTSDNCQTG